MRRSWSRWVARHLRRDLQSLFEPGYGPIAGASADNETCPHGKIFHSIIGLHGFAEQSLQTEPARATLHRGQQREADSPTLPSIPHGYGELTLLICDVERAIRFADDTFTAITINFGDDHETGHAVLTGHARDFVRRPMNRSRRDGRDSERK
jgi:hypothetical protein